MTLLASANNAFVFVDLGEPLPVAHAPMQNKHPESILSTF
jgi:hypothetical protein